MRREVIGAAELWLGDCLRVMRELPDASVDLVLCDPPFCAGGRHEALKAARISSMTRDTGKGWIAGDQMSTDGFTHLARECGLEWRRLLKPGAHVLVFADQRMASHASRAIESADLRKNGQLVWNKVHIGMGANFRKQHELILHFSNGVGNPPLRRDVGDVIDCPPIRRGDHPTQKPLPLLDTLLSVLCPVGGLVLDPFFGSGSTAVAAVASRRRFVGSEREAEYFNAAVRRVSEAQAGSIAA